MVYLNSISSEVGTISSAITQNAEETWKDLWKMELEDRIAPFLPNSSEALHKLLRQTTSSLPEIISQDKVKKDSHPKFTSLIDPSMIDSQDLTTLENNYCHYYRKQENADKLQIPILQMPPCHLSDTPSNIANPPLIQDVSDHMMISPYSELLTPNWLDAFAINIPDHIEDQKHKPSVQATQPFSWDSPSSFTPSEYHDTFEHDGQIQPYPSFPYHLQMQEHPSTFQLTSGLDGNFEMYYQAYPHPFVMSMPGLGPEDYHHLMGLYEQDNHQKPPFSYSQLITRAILESSERKLLLSDIYNWIVETFPYYRTTDAPWKNSIRHNLSVNKCFKKIPRRGDQPGKGSYWTLGPDQLEPNGTAKPCSPENTKEDILNTPIKRKLPVIEENGELHQVKKSKSMD